MSKSTKAADSRMRVRMQMAQQKDVEMLRDRLSRKGPLWSEWEYKLRNGHVLIYSPVTPWNEKHEPDPALRYMAMHLRIAPSQPGPFRLEFRRHTEQWWPLGACPPGTMEQIADFIEDDPTGWCRPMDQDAWERQHAAKDAPAEESGTSEDAPDALENHVSETLRPRFQKVVDLLDAFCDAHLDDAYKTLCRDMAVAVCQEGSPVSSGKAESWAAGIVYSVSWVNFLTDPSQTPHMKADDIARNIGVSPATMHAKSRIIREGLDLMAFDPDWTVPSLLDQNPLVWMLEVNGLLIDVRKAPREVQEAAFQRGLIPYIPADR